MTTWLWLLFSAATLFGVILAISAVMNRPPSRLLKMAHGGFVVAGLVILGSIAWAGKHGLWAALILALIVVASGVITSIKRTRQKASDMPVAIHSILALLWYVSLVTLLALE
ncbi:hypothetical protein [Carnimonas nigrificans]|uniref:hypothetical protein n=1 Tax=Carnimonas nigrificans TaxID=64323 RepID=UPI0004ADADFE|nr:hypothetical protein [Carnimonas nigrificans]